ncbi:hypothetical protein ACP4OV_022830 [Aristida adscensionis]
MKERQRWRPEEDAVLRAYVRQHGPREWHLVSQRMNVALQRDAKSCLERWKNYLRPGIKKGALSEEEQRQVIRLQAKHGNKWKKIAAEVPGRTAKRLGKWWEVFKDKQQRQLRDARRPPPPPTPDDRGRYDWLLENFAEKLVNDHHHHQQQLMAAPVLPPWLSSGAGGHQPPPPVLSPGPPPTPPPASPSVTLSLASSAPAAWMQPPPDRAAAEAAAAFGFPCPPAPGAPPAAAPAAPVAMDAQALGELAECCRELEEGHRAWQQHRKEAAWRLGRVELQLESERAARRREAADEFEAKMRALRQEQAAALERVEAEFRDKVAALRRDAELKEQKAAEQWASKHARLAKIVDQFGCSRRWAAAADMNTR